MHKSAYFLLSALLLLSFSCNRDRTLWDGEYFSTLDNGFAESEFSAIQQMIEVEARADSAVYGKTGAVTGLFCPDAVVTVTANGSNVVMRIDFSSGTNCLDGRLRTGALIATFNGFWKNENSTVTIVPESYTVAGYSFFFTQTILVNPRNTAGQINWTTRVVDAELLHPQNGQISWDSERTTTWVEGEDTPLVFQDDAFEVTGTANGISRTNRGFDVTITNPLRIIGDCGYVVAGAIELTPQQLATRTIDYGQGACDNRILLTVGNFQQEYFLP